MFILNESPGTIFSIENYFMGISMGWTTPAMTFFPMAGTMPESFADIPFDPNGNLELHRACKGVCYSRFTVDHESGKIEYLSPGPDRTPGPENLFKQHWYDESRSMWNLSPRAAYREKYPLEFDPTTELSISVQYQDLVSIGARSNIDSSLFASGNNNNQNYVTGSRYAYNYPIVLEYDQVVTLDHLSMQQTHSGSSYDNTGCKIEMWDSTLNEGAGGWTNQQSISYGGGNTQNEIDLSGRGLTSDKFRVIGNDTGKYGWIWKYFNFLSNTEPTVVPYDIEWALIGPMFSGATSLYSGSFYNFAGARADTGFGRKEPRLPFAMVSVGNAEREGTLVLTQSANIAGKVNIEPRIITFSI